jgi:SH3-like domain-containing protein
MARRIALFLLMTLGALAQTAASAQQERQTPYWASISATRAMMRTGPGQNYPATWLYVRAGLPIRVVEVYPSWRKVQDPDGATGWMLVRLLSEARTGLVTGTEPRPMHEESDPSSPVRYLAEPGVVGRLERCSDGWCRFDVGGRGGFIRMEHIWGTNPGEAF